MPRPLNNFLDPKETCGSNGNQAPLCAFNCFNGFILLGYGRRPAPVNSSTGLTLAMVAAPEPVFVPLRVAVEDSTLVCWPTEFAGYELYCNTNLNLTDWALVPGVTNRHIEPPPLPPEQYFRLSMPWRKGQWPNPHPPR